MPVGKERQKPTGKLKIAKLFPTASRIYFTPGNIKEARFLFRLSLLFFMLGEKIMVILAFFIISTTIVAFILYLRLIWLEKKSKKR